MADENKDGSLGTVLLAGGANLAIAVAKLVAGALTGSSAMLAEGAHSVIPVEGTDDKVFEAYQELLEQVASDAFDSDASDQAGCVLVTKEAQRGCC